MVFLYLPGPHSSAQADLRIYTGLFLYIWCQKWDKISLRQATARDRCTIKQQGKWQYGVSGFQTTLHPSTIMTKDLSCKRKLTNSNDFLQLHLIKPCKHTIRVLEGSLRLHELLVVSVEGCKVVMDQPTSRQKKARITYEQLDL